MDAIVYIYVDSCQYVSSKLYIYNYRAICTYIYIRHTFYHGKSSTESALAAPIDSSLS
jgi:hypothetical protein